MSSSVCALLLGEIRSFRSRILSSQKRRIFTAGTEGALTTSERSVNAFSNFLGSSGVGEIVDML